MSSILSRLKKPPKIVPRSIFDQAKLVSTDKTPWSDLSEEDQKAWNPFMVNRILSLNPKNLELVTLVQMNVNMPPSAVYEVYCDMLPNGYRYTPLMKGSGKLNEIKAVADHYGVSKREAREYIKLLSEGEIAEMVSDYSEEDFTSHKIKKSK